MLYIGGSLIADIVHAVELFSSSCPIRYLIKHTMVWHMSECMRFMLKILDFLFFVYAEMLESAEATLRFLGGALHIKHCH